jgi:hypothetical protein
MPNGRAPPKGPTVFSSPAGKLSFDKKGVRQDNSTAGGKGLHHQSLRGKELSHSENVLTELIYALRH